MDKKILIIDDEEQDRKAMAVALKKSGYTEILFAENGESGVEAAKLFDPDIILIDVVLQNVDGFDICIEMREANVRAKIIMVTGHLDAVNAKKAVKSGADEIIEKEAGYNNIHPTIQDITGGQY